jgi:hypothetical protein
VRTADRFLNLKLISLAGLISVLTACGQVGGNSSGSPLNSTSPSGPSTGGPSTGDGVGALYTPSPLLWEGKNKDGVLWSSFVYQIIGNSSAQQLLPGSGDITDFCPAYATATNPERVNFWGFLISSIAKYESSFIPTERFLENGLGTDPITKLPVYSEGLLQLSYQDIQAYPFCEFDWAADRLLAPNDPKKTILDPFKNLECGIKILANQIEKKGNIALTSGVYWSTLKLNGTYSKVPQIQAMTKALPFCKLPQ